ncbi:MAG: hypothetical protein WDW38_001949 [Sanguina aurantia]
MSFSFPILVDEDLLPCLADMEIPMDASALAKPTYEIVRPLFEHIVIMLTGVTREDLMQPVFTAMDAFEFPELHDESISANNFFRQLSKLLGASGVKDFSWRDVFKPEPARLRRHLSAIINFAKFREEKLAAYQQMAADMEAKGEQMQALEQDYSRQLSELKRWQGDRSHQAEEVRGVEAETGQHQAQNQKLSKQAQALQDEVRQLKAGSNTLADQASQVKLEVCAMQQEMEQLRDQVVQSPEKHRLAIAELSITADSKRLYYAQLNSTAIENDRKLEMIVKLDRELARCLRLLTELDVAVAKKKDVSQSVKDARASISGNERALADVSNTSSTYQRHHANLLDKLQRTQHQAELKLEAAESAVQQQLKGREAVHAEIAAAEARAAESDAAIREITDRQLELEQGCSAQVRGAVERFGLLRKAMGGYYSKLTSAAIVLPQQQQGQQQAGLESAMGGLQLEHSRPGQGR